MTRDWAGTAVGIALLPLSWPVAAVLAVLAWRGQPELDEVMERPLRREVERAVVVPELDVAS